MNEESYRNTDNDNSGNGETATARAEAKPKKQRGFAVMDPDQVREIARKGGVAAHKAGTAHKFTPEEARQAGRKGHEVARANKARSGRKTNGPDP